MLYLGLLKRIVPFVLTFAAGLLIASFFVSVALPKVGSGEGRSWRKGRHCSHVRELRELREENLRLREQLAEAETRASWYRDGLGAVPAPAISELPPPPRIHSSYGTGSGYGSGSGSGR